MATTRYLIPLLALCSAGAQARPALSIFKKKIKVTVTQNRRPVKIKGDTATLKRAPFDVIVTTRDPSRGILMNVSPDATLFDRARSGAALTKNFHQGTGMAEEMVIKEKSLFISGPSAHHYLIRSKKGGINRYHEVKSSGGGYRCRRSVDSFYLVSTRKTVKVAALPHDRVHLVLFMGRLGGVESAEEARAYLRIKFRKR